MTKKKRNWLKGKILEQKTHEEWLLAHRPVMWVMIGGTKSTRVERKNYI